MSIILWMIIIVAPFFADPSSLRVMNKIRNISNDNYYYDYDISDGDNQNLADDLVYMDDATYNILSDKFKSLGYSDISRDAGYCISAKNDWVNIHVYSCSDEWFIVIAHGHYKCDQVEGVIKLIDDLQYCIDGK